MAQAQAQAQQYAKDQPTGFKNYVENIAIVGAGGRVGAFIAQELLRAKKHRVTALTRVGSDSKLAPGLEIKQIDYESQSSLVEALRGQDVLIITMAVTAPPEQEANLIRAAAQAGVPWVMPNEYGVDMSDETAAKEAMVFDARHQARELIKSLGKSAYVSLVCGMWYEFSLAGLPMRYGFDFPGRTVTFFDDGKTKINTSTWEQCGRAVARLFSLKLLPDDAADQGPTLTQYKNNFVYISSFLLSQRDMFESVLRVTGTTESDWTINYQDVKQRYKDGVAEMQKGRWQGFAKLLYSRVFYPDGYGNFQAKFGLYNRVLGLPEEDLDERTKVAVIMAEESESDGSH